MTGDLEAEFLFCDWIFWEPICTFSFDTFLSSLVTSLHCFFCIFFRFFEYIGAPLYGGPLCKELPRRTHLMSYATPMIYAIPMSYATPHEL
jgi:hypothetical protein